jgi:hypothetical protein
VCAGGSTCNATLAAGSTLDCQGVSVCDVNCPSGSCTVLCAGDAKCSCTGDGCALRCVGGVPRSCAGQLVCVRAGVGTCP